MSKLLGALVALSTLALAALEISQMAAQPDPPPLLVWFADQLDFALGELGPFWEKAQRLEEPGSVFSLEYFWYFLFRSTWEIWKAWLIIAAVSGTVVWIFGWFLDGMLDFESFFEGEIVAPAIGAFFWLLVIKSFLIFARYGWLLVEHLTV